MGNPSKAVDDSEQQLRSVIPRGVLHPASFFRERLENEILISSWPCLHVFIFMNKMVYVAFDILHLPFLLVEGHPAG